MRVMFEPKLESEISHEHDAEQIAAYQQAADAVWGTTWGEQVNVQSTNQQADSLEAHSLKYQACAQIMQLSSGNFALFGAYRAGGGSGIELIAIGTWEELESHVRDYKALADGAHEKNQQRTLPAKIAADYDNLFGDDQP